MIPTKPMKPAHQPNAHASGEMGRSSHSSVRVVGGFEESTSVEVWEFHGGDVRRGVRSRR